MKVTGNATVSAPLPRVWDALQDPAVLARTIPGCHSLEATGADTYRMTVSAGVASVRGTYVGQVELAEPDPPRSFVLRARGQGAPGTVDATVLVRLAEGEEGTRIEYDADATVGGMIGGVGQRMLGSVAKKTAGEFFAAVERALTEPEPVVAPTPAVPVAVPEAGTVYEGRAVQNGRAEAPGTWPMAVAFGSGGAVALVGVALGYALGRRSRR